VAAEILTALAGCVNNVVAAACSGNHVLPASADEAQDAIGAAYSLLALHGPWLASADAAPSGPPALVAVGGAMLSLLQV
jgi:hypothetical protein